MVAFKQIFISFIPALLIASLSAAIAYSVTLGAISIDADIAVFCAALALAVASVFGAILGRSALAHTALFCFAIFWLLVGAKMQNAALECVKALSWHVIPIVAATTAILKERAFWSAHGILRLLCLSIALFFMVLLCLSPYAINAAAALQYGLGGTFLGAPIGAIAVYAIAWIVFLARAISQTRKLVPSALAIACGEFMAGLFFASDRALCALFFGAGAITLIIGSAPFSFVKPAGKKERAFNVSLQPKIGAPKAPSRLFPKPSLGVAPKLAELKERVLERVKTPFGAPKIPLVLAHPDLKFFNLQSKVNVALSPAYYWYKRSEAPFKSRRLAKRFAASLFFGWIPEGSYRYFAFREDNGWGFIACDLAATTQKLIEQGLDSMQISRIYFAQNALNPADQPIALSESAALSFVDGAWVALPAKFAADAKPFDESPRALRAPSFAPIRSRETNDISSGRFRLAASFLLTLIAALAIDIFRLSAAASAADRDREEILAREKLPATRIQLESIERRLTQTASAQQGLRLTLNKLLTFAPAARLEKLDIDGRTIAARFAPNDAINAQTIIDRLKTALPDAQAVEQGGKVMAAAKW
ncbi:MAG: hypothetical protein LBO72_06595 [Helicobacteraceae bacterium]|nr:hypothetical protein [Helicobacteraceae bacterium]